MEDAPLSIAHQHAIQASTILSSSTPPTRATLSAAALSHALAATSFASAAKTTKDLEAHRTLELLVQEHESWAARLKKLAEHPQRRQYVESSSSGGTTHDGQSAKHYELASLPSKHSNEAVQHKPVLPLANTTGVLHYPARLQKSTSSLATNLASARGIPQPLHPVPTTSPPSRRRRTNPSTVTVANNEGSSKFNSSSPSIINPDQLSFPGRTLQDESFSKFYSSLNSLIHRIGSPFTASLAFTGLPIGEETGNNEVKVDILPKGWTQGRGRGRNLGLDNDTAGGESFYVVPASGGTMSYAGIVQRENGVMRESGTPEYQRNSKKQNISEGVAKPAQESRLGRYVDFERDEELARYVGHSEKTHEELQLENATLRRTLESLTRSMSKWQKKSRESESMLKNSILALSKNNGQTGMDILSQVQRRSWLHVPSEENGGFDEFCSEGRRVGEIELASDEDSQKLRDISEQVSQIRQEYKECKLQNERLMRENERLRRYKERWDDLKKNAKNRPKLKAGTGEQTSGSTTERLLAVDEAAEK